MSYKVILLLGIHGLLRLLLPFAVPFGKKNCTRASFNKTPTNYISEESLINVIIYENTISAMFSFRNTQEAVRRETTKGSSIEFIGCWILPHEQNGCVALLPRHQSIKVCREILIFNTFFPWCPFTPHVSHIFSYSSLRCVYLDNQSEYRKIPAPFC